MSQQNIELIKGLYASFGTRDMAAILSSVSDEMSVVQSAELPWGGLYEGKEGLQRFLGMLMKHLNNKALVIERYLDAGDHIVAIGRTQGTVLSTDKPFDVPLAHVWQIREGKAVKFTPYIDNPLMHEALRP